VGLSEVVVDFKLSRNNSVDILNCRIEMAELDLKIKAVIGFSG
jgi:hypothetical protein